MYMDNLKLVGFRTHIDSVEETLKEINSVTKSGEIIQLLNADSIAGDDHIIHGVNQAFLSFQRGENLAKDISVEIVLRCSAQRQISQAFKMLGLKEGSVNLCAVLINCSDDYMGRFPDKFIVSESICNDDSDYLMELYDINEMEADNFGIEKCIIDKISKLSVDY